MAEKTVPTTHEEATPRETTRTREQYIAPPVDIYEDDEGLTVLADMPGVEPSDLDVRVENGILTLQARSKDIQPGDVYYQEFELASFFRQFQLSEEVNVNGITADLRDGVLTLRLPKAERAKPRRIQVRTQAQGQESQ